MTILKYFPYPKPRPSQLKVLEWVEQNWDRYDLMVLQCPVAAGKSGLAVTIANWANQEHGVLTGITTPDNILVNQYKRDFNLLTLPCRSSFASGDLYVQAKNEFKSAPLKVMNNYTLLANRAYSDLQIADEAHQLIPMLQDFEGIRIWHHLEGYPKTIKTIADLLVWAGSRGPKDRLGKKITKLVSRNPMDYVVVQDQEIYRGQLRDYLRIYPLTPKNNKPILWPPSKVRKLILMSATIAKPDIEDLGLHNRRVGYIEVPSDISPANRPFIFVGQGSMGRDGSSDTLPKIMSKLRDIHNGNGGRGLLHTTYGLSAKLQAGPKIPALLFHGTYDKRDKLNGWLYDRSDKRTFVGCGLTTGLDLKYDVCNWQAIMKCQFPDLGDPAVAAKAERNPEWYAWTTIKQIVQAYGRVCRAPDDRGATYMLDSDFIRLYTEYKHLWPTWFCESVTY